MKNGKFVLTVCVLSGMMAVNGCALIVQKGRRSDLEKIESLERELDRLRTARANLEDKLKNEIENEFVKLEMQEKGLVITVLGEVLFDPGKAKLRSESFGILDQIANLLQSEVSGHKVGIEGHTDSTPIKHSGWKSNWELSAQRALSVLHHMADNGIAPERLSVIGYGEYQSVASNSTREGRQLNRRVEIVVYPNNTISKKDVQDYNDSFK
jgi:chemotaxis protein MotB